MDLRSMVPALTWIKEYKRENLRGDLSAGLTVGVMLIPQGMAYALLAGLPPIYGLYAATLPLIVYALFGTSRQLAVGPVAMVALLISAGVSNLAQPGSDEYVQLAILLALMVGLLQLGLGIFRLGFIVNFLSHPVISGFTSAAALIIGLSQLKHLLGIPIPRSHFIHEVLYQAWKLGSEIHLPTLLIGITGMVVILGLRRVNPTFPGQLMAVILGIIIVFAMDLDQKGMKIVGEVPQGLPQLSVPGLSSDSLLELLPIALAIGLVGFMESIAVAKAIQAKHKDYEVKSNQELIGLGMANIVGSLFQSFPTTGGFSRTAVNDQAGARTGLASILSALLIVLTLLFLTPLFYYLPNTILASVIMVAVFGLIDLKEPINLWKNDRRDFFMLVITFVGTLMLGIEMGIAIGVVLSLAMVIYQAAYPHIAVLGKLPDTTLYRNINRFPEAIQRAEILVIRFDAPLFFANIGYLKDKLDHIENEKGGKIELVVLSSESITDIDSTAMHALSDLIDSYRARGIDLYLAGVIGPVRDKLVRSGLAEKIGKSNFFMHAHDAIEYFRSISPKESEKIDQRAIQSNIE